MTVTDVSGLDWVRLVFVDVFGGPHSIQLPAARFADAARNGVPFDGSALAGPARQLAEDMRLLPDTATRVRDGERTGRVVCMAAGPDRSPWPGDPRAALVSAVDDLDELTSQWRAAAELEFYLLDAAGRPVDEAGYFSDEEGPGMAVARSAAMRLCEVGVDVLTCHHEAGPGQFELDLAPTDALGLADAIVLAKQVVREIAADAGVRATFMARPFAGQPGSGLHLHQSLGGRLVQGGRLDADGSAYVAGLLAHAPALTALAAPGVNSYKRLHAGPEAPGAIMWAHTNRAALVRVGSSAGLGPAIEFRAADPTANPYLLVAGLLVAAGDGLSSGLELAPPFEEDVAGFDPAARTVRYEPLPRDLDDALDALLADDVLVDAFDSRLLTRLVDGRRAEAEAYRREITQWERERYLSS